jgi:pentose-5-phosphate-3-epimerase
MASVVPNIRNINKNRTYSKTIHLLVEMNNHIIEGLVDSGTSMSIITINVFRELNIMHLVIGSKSYKTTSRMVT